MALPQRPANDGAFCVIWRRASLSPMALPQRRGAFCVIGCHAALSLVALSQRPANGGALMALPPRRVASAYYPDATNIGAGRLP